MTNTTGARRARAVAGYTFSALLCALGALSCADANRSACPTYACINMASLSGDAIWSPEVNQAEFRLCVDDVCRDGSIDLSATDTGDPCAVWGLGSHVCLSRSPDSTVVSVDVAWAFASEIAPHDASVHLVVADHDGGSVLIDETHTASYEISREDVCHRCWQASATF